LSGELNPALDDGLRQLSGQQQIQFRQYIRYVLPLDGYVFWLATASTTVFGSLHIAAYESQNEDENLAINRVTFSTSQQVDVLNDIAPNAIWVAEYSGLKFAFSQRGPYYENAGIYHYGGEAVYPAMQSQLVDVGSQLSPSMLIVSNSLPAWLTIATYDPVWLVPANPAVTLYPSMAVPANLRPPYGSVHIFPEGTEAIQSVPILDQGTASHQQAATDRVRVTLYGLTNSQASDWFDTALAYMRDQNVIGLMNSPTLRDEKRGQVGLDILAMKKTAEFNVSYNQTRINDVALQLIKTVTATVNPNGVPL
jgi:hypothetical protein